MAGAIPPDQGAVLLSGADLGSMTRRDRARHLALVQQESAPDVARRLRGDGAEAVVLTPA